MAQGYSLFLIPTEPTYRPTPQQVTAVVKFLAERLEIPGDYSVNGEEELSMESALEHLRAGVQATHGGTECVVSFNDLVSGSLFGYEPESPDPDQNFWSDELRLYTTALPFPYCDWSYEEAACPACNQRITEIHDELEEVRLSGDPIKCPCGAGTLPEDLKKTPGVRYAQYRDAFQDAEFLSTLEETLGTPLEVLAVQS
jgi:hypothetical protein